MRFQKLIAAGLLLAGTGLLPGCRSMGQGAQNGALIGALLGAGGGYAVGHHRGNRGNYALAGAAAGAMAGYIIGDQTDHRASGPGPEIIEESAPRRVVRRRYVVRDECDPYPPGW